MKENPPAESPDWRSRGYLPHFDQPDLIQFVTIRLYDAVPEELVKKWKSELLWNEKLPASDRRCAALRRRIDKYEDSCFGACWLKNEAIAALVQSSLLHFDGERYRLLAWCIMPNHLHFIVEIWENHPLDEVMHSLKSYTAHEANKILKRRGIFWFPEYHDRYIRNERHLAAAIDYAEMNPVKARLVAGKELWKWSSAKFPAIGCRD